MTDKQPNALRLADALDVGIYDAAMARTMDQAAAELRRLHALNEALRADAERYRWLRDVASGSDWEHIGQTTDTTNTDARIDECMAAYKAVGAA